MSNLLNQILLNQYRVDAYVSSGGMGTVYRVWDLKRNVPLAMKVLHSELAEDPAIFKRFQREARALQKLAHPNIVPFYGLYQVQGFAFLLERFIDGPSLQDVLKQQPGEPLPTGEVLAYLKAICAALGYAHAHGVVHCDVKPGNIMIDRGGNIYLTDFGVARHAESTTTTMGAAGTPAYMAPEQIRAEPVSPASDVYALGVMLFELLTGQRPFKGTESGTESAGQTLNERIRYAQQFLPPPDPRSLNPEISESTVQVILQTLAKKPEERQQTTQEFYESVCQAMGWNPQSVPERISLSSKPQPYEPQDQIRPVSTPEAQIKHHKPRLNNRIGIYVAGATIVLLAAIFFFVKGGSDLPSAAETLPAEVANVSMISSTTGPDTREPDSLPTSPPAPTSTLTPSPMPTATSTLAPVPAQPGSLVLRDGETVPWPVEPISEANFQQVAELGRWNFGDRVFRVRFSQDGAWMASAHYHPKEFPKGIVYLWNLARGGAPVQVARSQFGMGGLDISADGKYLAWADWGGSVGLYLLPEGSSVGEIAREGTSLNAAGFSPDSRLLTWAVKSGPLLVRRLDAGGGNEILMGGSYNAFDIAFSPDGLHVAVAAEDGNIVVQNLETGTTEAYYLGEAAAGVAFSLHGNLLAASSRGNGKVMVWKFPSGEVVLEGYTGAVTSDVVFSQNGQMVITGDENGEIKFWSLKTGQNLGGARTAPGAISSLAISADHKLLATGDREGRILLWGIPAEDTSGSTQQEIATLQDQAVQSVVVTLPKQEDILNTRSIWNLDPFKNLHSPGTAEYAAQVRTGEEWIWDFSWCAIDSARLKEILSPLSVTFLIDEQPVPDSLIFEQEREAISLPGWQCHYWRTKLQDWSRGSTVKLDISYTLSTQIFDGEDHYPPGEHHHHLYIDVK